MHSPPHKAKPALQLTEQPPPTQLLVPLLTDIDGIGTLVNPVDGRTASP
jgi:hypothetical protein